MLHSVVLPDVSNHPVVIYATIAFVVVTLFSTSFAKLLGPVSKAIKEFADARRNKASQEEDIELADLRRQLAYCKGELENARKYEHKAQAQAMVHAAWDYEILREFHKTDPQWPGAPAILPRDED